jgi:superfamily II DNA or RNA helicase
LLDTLKEHQDVAIETLGQAFVQAGRGAPGMWLADAPGAGKTLTALSTACVVTRLQATAYSSPHKGVLIVVPPNLLEPSWQQEWNTRWSRIFPRDFNPIFLPTMAQVRARPPGSVRAGEVYVIPSSAFSHLGGQARGGGTKRSRAGDATSAAVASTFLSSDWLLVIVDEAHTYKNAKSQRFASLQSICRRSRFRILMTGSPLVNKEEDVIGLTNALLVHSGQDTDMAGIRHGLMLRREPQGGPKVVTEVVELELSKEERALYAAVDEILGAGVEKHMAMGKALARQNRVMRLRMLVSSVQAFYRSLQGTRERQAVRMPSTREERHRWLTDHGILEEDMDEDTFPKQFWEVAAKTTEFCLRDLEHLGMGIGTFSGKETKVEYLADLVQGLVKEDSSSPVIVFVNFVLMQDRVRQVLEARGLTVAHLRGDMKADERSSAISLAQQCAVQVFLIMLPCGCVGLNLMESYRVVFAEPSYVPAMEEQGIGRVKRLGQKHSEIRVWRLVAKGTVDERAMEIQEDKVDLMADFYEDTGNKLHSLLGLRR